MMNANISNPTVSDLIERMNAAVLPSDRNAAAYTSACIDEIKKYHKLRKQFFTVSGEKAFKLAEECGESASFIYGYFDEFFNEEKECYIDLEDAEFLLTDHPKELLIVFATLYNRFYAPEDKPRYTINA